ncbi:hypothetical protein [Myxococcus sp. RHSTA-1-4]|nr:hypothetical protein [Myxococcus sp. RHSTA-1-4]
MANHFEGAKYTGRDARMRSVVECVRGGFRDAAAQGRGLVSYYH